ncbi:hypothetical protein AB0F81_06450, partial [Actinoplanes sp. NPDC024001]
MNRNQLTTIGVGILLGLILLFVVLASCGPDDDGTNTGQPVPSASGSVAASEPATTPSGTLPPDPGATNPPAAEPSRSRTSAPAT